MRSVPSILHLDMDAFFAAVEQASKPSLRGKPVVVGGLGGRGVVSTASYEARRFGVHSAMPMAQARRLCPNAAFLVPRFELYRQVSDVVMGLLRELSPLVEPLSVDEAFVDLEAGPYGELLRAGGPAEGAELVRAVGEDLRADILAGVGLTASVGLSGTKFLAKIASEQAKPDGLVLIEPGREREVLDELPVRALPGVGPATAETLRRIGLTRISEVARTSQDELVRLLGRAHGAGVHALALGRDDRPVVADRDAKSVSVEDTFEVDLNDADRIRFELDRLTERCVRRLRAAGRSGRTVVVKVRRFDFSTLTRSETLPAPTDDPLVISAMARRLLAQVALAGGVRLLGVGVSGLADFTQEDLFAQAQREAEGGADTGSAEADGPETGGAGAGRDGAADGRDEQEAAYGGPSAPRAFHPGAAPARRWMPGQDVEHAEQGRGWVQGSGVGRVTVRFEVPWGAPGRVRTFAVEDPALAPATALPLAGTPRTAPPAADRAAPRAAGR
ncbi:DNA polymerase IV [Streptacidiphilus sp. PB12-B1b]|uniref:DNA polymerase IV n=1 Tax=Streptacidiphilus sp. PB12-B1b TaxID=2705012 RepID=UPI0015FDCEBC|nr:DNA polymerase IV [Streptacidiphilus sp. PB12-B1b]QMU76282.1 DNA polymerase IV [Streptacidiphilus sp. PB12-B1b]